MIGWIVIATVSMTVIAVAHHLGFIEKAYAVCGDIARCPMCSVFWGTIGVLIVTGCRPLEAVALSFAAALFSNWVGLLLWVAKRYYDFLWERLDRNPRSR